MHYAANIVPIATRLIGAIARRVLGVSEECVCRVCEDLNILSKMIMCALTRLLIDGVTRRGSSDVTYK